MKTFWPQSLAGRLIIWLMLVLTLALAMALALHQTSNQRLMVRLAEKDAVTRITMVTRILEQSDTAERLQTLHAATSDDLSFSVQDNDHGKAERTYSFFSDKKHAKDKSHKRFQSILRPGRESKKAKKEKKVWVIEQQPTQTFERSITVTTKDDDPFHQKFRHPPDLNNMLESMVIDTDTSQFDTINFKTRLHDGRWLNAAYKPDMPSLWTRNSAAFLGILVLVIGGVIVLVVRTETRPMQRLAQAAEALGRGEHLPPLDEHGPREIRLAVEAFNLMGARLGNFVQDRTRMLAAMSHDLRTPLTTLRLRAEMIDEPEVREKLIETIEEMHRITEASLSFAREEDNTEETQKTDLSALVQDLCKEANAMGKDARMESETSPIHARVRPAAMRRAVRNLIDNAVRYGERARLSIETDAKEARIIIADNGPGISEAQLEDVFAPFVRLENSRNTETGGAGLGLAIARTIARSHGGDVVLRNEESGGLCAILSLPNRAATER